MQRSKTSKAWMREHVSDPFVQQAKQDGYRSRAAYKLIEIDQKDHLFKKGMAVVDLGSTPGGWTQVAVEKGCRVYALDILPMEPVSGSHFILGDFREEAPLAELENALGGNLVDLVISDMAPNISGVSVSDQARSIYLAELALEFCRQQLKPGGNFLVKVFQGEGFEAYLKSMKAVFRKVSSRKPKASRDRSSEIYLLGLLKEND